MLLSNNSPILQNNPHTFLPKEIEKVMPILKTHFPAAFPSIQENLLRFFETHSKVKQQGISCYKSKLTPGGYPLEWNINSHSTIPAYTVDPCLPNTTLAEKYTFLKSGTFIPDWPADYRHTFYTNQEQHRYGCFVGIRHQHDLVKYKIYHEVSSAFFPELFNDFLEKSGYPLNIKKLKPLLCGADTSDLKSKEYYFQLLQPDIAYFQDLFSYCGINRQLPIVLDLFSFLAGIAKDQIFNSIRFGISFKVLKEHPPEITLFVHAAELFRSNLIATKKIEELLLQTGQANLFYKLLTETLANDYPSFPVHSTIGIKITPTQKIISSVGIRPW